MQPIWRRAHAWPAIVILFAVAADLSGCASPGPPRPPSLEIPRLVSDLSAKRSGDVVDLRFTVPERTTDGLPLRGTTVTVRLCRQLGGAASCIPVDAAETHAPLPITKGAPAPPVHWTDDLPLSLRTGAPRAIAYRIELRNAAGRTAGLSDPVYAAAGVAPPPVTGFKGEAMRLGVQLQWTPLTGAGEVLLERQAPLSAVAARPHPKPALGHAASTGKTSKSTRSGPATATRKDTETPGLTVLQADPGNPSAAATIDHDIDEGVAYRYVATRRVTEQIGGRALELRSAPSAELTVTWHDLYPPPQPTGLTAIGYTLPADAKSSGGFAVDLVWQPVDDTRLAGYLVYCQAIDASGVPAGPRRRLTPSPVLTPGYHDAAARPGQRYRYGVTAIDPKGNESAAAETVLESGS